MRKSDAARLLALQDQARDERQALARRATASLGQLRAQGAALRSGVGTLAWTAGAALIVRFVLRLVAANPGRVGSRSQVGVIRRTLRWGRRLSAIVAAVRLLAPAGPVTRRTTGVRTERALSGQPPRG